MAGGITVPISSSWDPSGVDKATRDLDGFGKSVGRGFGSIDDAIGRTIRNFGLMATAAAGAAVYGIARFGMDAIKAAEEAEVADNRIRAIANSMGLFGSSTDAVIDRMGDYADQLERTTAVDGDLIKSMQAQLLTFESVGRTASETGSTFDRATAAALDMQAANIGGAEAAIQLGKALEDPTRGVTALRKSGVTFTEAQRELIETLVDTGRTLEAQDMILDVVERQVGGTAAATATSSAKMRVAFEQVKETIGKALLPQVEKLTNFIVSDLLPKFQLWWDKHGPEVERIIAKIGETIGVLVTEYLPPFIETVREIANKLRDWWTESETLRPLLEDLAEWMKNNPDKVADFAIALFAVAAGMKAVSAFTGLASLLSGAGSAAQGAGILAGGAAGGWMALAGALGAAAAALGYYLYLEKQETQEMMEADQKRLDEGPWWKGFGAGLSSGGSGFMGVGATGGIVSQPTLAMIGEAGPEAVVPLSSMPGASPLPSDLGTGGGVTINVSGAIDPVGVADQIAQLLNARGYRNGFVR